MGNLSGFQGLVWAGNAHPVLHRVFVNNMDLNVGSCGQNDPMRDVFDHTKGWISQGLQDVGEHMLGFLFWIWTLREKDCFEC